MCMVLIMVFGTYLDTYADNKPSGQPQEKVYVNCGIPTPYKNVKFYDCQIPFALTYTEIGGIDKNMSANVKKYKVGTSMWRENCHSADILKNTKMGKNNVPSGCSVSDVDGICVAKDKLGQQYYIAALGQWCFKATKSNEDKGYKISGAQLYDIILTDGTIIHFVQGDAIGWGHSLGCENTGQDGVNYTRTKLNYEQYKGMCHANGGQLIEFWSQDTNGHSRFGQKYKIGSGKKDNQIAYIRMYNKSIDQATDRGHTELSCKSDGSFNEVEAGGSSGGNTGDNATNSGSFVVSEWELKGMPSQSALSNGREEVNLPDREGLGIAEVYSVDLIGEDIRLYNQALSMDNARIFISFVGLCLIIYSVLMFVAMVFDRSNVFIDISMVSILTLGKLKYSPYEEDNRVNKKGQSNTAKLLISTIVILIVGMLIISGAIWNGMSNIVFEFSQKFM